MPPSIVPILRDMFPHTVTVKRWTGSSGYGERSEAASVVTVKARIIGRSRNIIGADGQEYISSVQAVLDGPYNFTVRDEFTLPPEFALGSDEFSQQPRAIAIDRSSDENGGHHETVYFTAQPRLRGF